MSSENLSSNSSPTKNTTGDKIKIVLQYAMPKHAISRLVGKLAAAKMGWLTTKLIDIFINAYGIIGAALATLIVIVFINICKILLNYAVYKIHPYNSKSLSIVLSIFLIYGIIYSIPTLIHPFLSIAIRSLLIVSLFMIPLFLFRWSSDIQALIERFKKIF